MQTKKLRIDIDKVRRAPVDPMNTLKGRCTLNEKAASDLDASVLDGAAPEPTLSSAERQKLKDVEDRLLKDILDHLEAAVGDDESVYVGGPGVAWMLLQASAARSQPELLSSVPATLDRWDRVHRTEMCKEPDIGCSLLCGYSGWMVVAARYEVARGKRAAAESVADRYCRLAETAMSSDLDADEWLYGRAGYLQGLLQLHSLLGEAAVPRKLMVSLALYILKRGVECSRRLDSGLPLMWTWHGKQYLGGAHGVAGILYIILQFPEVVADPTWRSNIMGTLDALASLQTDNGNWPGKVGERYDHLMHFCHGAPGMVWTYCAAYEVLGEARYLDVARSAGDAVWRYGLVRKGDGLCHGIAGNAYAFLRLLRTTKDQSWLLRAHYFAERLHAQDPNAAAQRRPDNPYSLFEGSAGTVCFLMELRGASPAGARLPFFDVP
eukprot:TRINITY_DN30325_c0_g1_i1.p1 TRINITY_DN30325_c0_g1~~TRINITY_DN30325_c0_g1_i1.p1  ORF type:complete len:437 (-),score=54.68 TRINITY_DN30325_c0_g1_i1:87-1397(-)